MFLELRAAPIPFHVQNRTKPAVTTINHLIGEQLRSLTGCERYGHLLIINRLAELPTAALEVALKKPAASVGFNQREP
jgi:hypothetical protein